MTNMTANLTAHWGTIRAVLIGMILGYLYHRLVGCDSGGCMISGNPVISTLYGGLLGYLWKGSGVRQ
jgi:hypothetical protein